MLETDHPAAPMRSEAPAAPPAPAPEEAHPPAPVVPIASPAPVEVAAPQPTAAPVVGPVGESAAEEDEGSRSQMLERFTTRITPEQLAQLHMLAVKLNLRRRSSEPRVTIQTLSAQGIDLLLEKYKDVLDS